ncbi:MAG TPA: hypothetical protein VNM67_13760 [Thermoanaerobaculia bacterium]|jgi:hypothetical protein|nr:hypothetical protein [Thermoanaerobaculia bacterium]
MKAFAVGLVLLAAPLAAAPPEISFEPDAVVARGISPNGHAVWFSVAREISRQSTNIVPRHAIEADEDGDGAVRLELGQEVPLRSIWFVVDLATGETGVAVPDGFPLLEMDLPGGAIPAALNRLDLQRRFAYLVLVRPGVGAWQLRVGDGGASDEDGESDGTLRAALSSLTPVEEGGPPAPGRFSPRDVLLVIDPERMEFATVRIGDHK